MTDFARIVLLSIMSLACAAVVRAQAGLRVELRAHSDFDEHLAERARGQSSDLPIDVGTYAPAHAASSMAAATAQAFAHCRESHADVVVWMLPGRSANAWQLAVATCKDQRLLVRRIDAARPALSDSNAVQSGVLETAALLLRAALSVLAHGGSVGVPTGADRPPPTAATASAAISDEPASAAKARSEESAVGESDDVEPPSAPHSAQAPRDEPEHSEDELRDTSRSALDVLALVGWQQTWENARRALSQPALAGAFALGGSRFKLGGAASLSFGNTYADAHTSLRIARHTLAAQARLGVVQLVDWSLSAGLELGAVIYSRSTRALEPRASAASSAVFTEPMLSAWLGAATRVGPLWFALAGGIEVLPWTPRFVYLRADGGEQRALQVWPIAPRVTLSLALGRP